MSRHKPKTSLSLRSLGCHQDTTPRVKRVKIGAKVVKHGSYGTFQLAEVAVSRDLFREILRLIDTLRPKPALA